MEILLVEDSLLDAHLAFRALEKSGIKHRLTLVRDGQETLDFLQQVGRFSRVPRPDLILLDLFLPKVNGLEVLQQIRSNASLQDIPVVVMTSANEQEMHERCDFYHVSSYLTKPVNLDGFLEVVRDLKKKFRLHDILI